MGTMVAQRRIQRTLRATEDIDNNLIQHPTWSNPITIQRLENGKNHIYIQY